MLPKDMKETLDPVEKKFIYRDVPRELRDVLWAAIRSDGTVTPGGKLGEHRLLFRPVAACRYPVRRENSMRRLKTQVKAHKEIGTPRAYLLAS